MRAFEVYVPLGCPSLGTTLAYLHQGVLVHVKVKPTSNINVISILCYGIMLVVSCIPVNFSEVTDIPLCIFHAYLLIKSKI